MIPQKSAKKTQGRGRRQTRALWSVYFLVVFFFLRFIRLSWMAPFILSMTNIGYPFQSLWINWNPLPMWCQRATNVTQHWMVVGTPTDKSYTTSIIVPPWFLYRAVVGTTLNNMDTISNKVIVGIQCCQILCRHWPLCMRISVRHFIRLNRKSSSPIVKAGYPVNQIFIRIPGLANRLCG